MAVALGGPAPQGSWYTMINKNIGKMKNRFVKKRDTRKHVPQIGDIIKFAGKSFQLRILWGCPYWHEVKK